MVAQQTNVAFSGSIPANYDEHLGPMFFEPFAIDIAERLRKLNPASVLVLACGTGRDTNLIAQALPHAKIVASDINPSMLNYAKGKVKADNIQWEIVDAVSLPFTDASFDCIVSQFGVMFYSDRPKAYAEAFRVLKPGGTFIFTAWDAIRYNPAAKLTDETLTHFFPVDTPAFYKVPFSYFEEKQIKSDLSLGGFQNSRMEVLKLNGRSASAANAAKGLIEGVPVYTAIVEKDATLLPAISNTLTNNLEALFGAKDLSVPVQGRLVTVSKAR